MHTTSIGYKRRVYERLPYKYLARNEKRQKAGAINIAIALERRALRRARIINCVADNLIEEVRDWYGMPNTVRTRKAVVLTDSGEVPLERAADAPFLFVGRLVAQKGLFDLLDAYRARKLTRPLHIIGDGVLRAALEAQARHDKLPVTFLGYRGNTEVGAAMKRAFALVAPSYYETQPMVAFEASAHALPVLAYQAAAVGDAVSPLNQPFLLPECDMAALGKALADLDAAPALAREIGRANRDLHLRENRFARMIDDYVGLYETVARGV
jgi:glycosyltransferase involved in cell wall biosynthesis